MSNENQNEFAVSVTKDVPRENSRLLPRFFRTLDNKKFLSGTLDPLTQPGKLTRINGFVGRRDIPNFQFEDSYVKENSTPRTYYQFEPGYVYEDIKTGEVEWFADYVDYMNQLKYFGANISNHSRLNKQESYSWDPYIDWDKVTNFREYYWLPEGPDAVKIYGQLENIESTIQVTVQDNVDNTSFLFSTSGQESNPRLVLYRGLKYTFQINAPNKKFAIKTSPATGSSNYYNIGVSAQNVENGTIEFDVITETPDLLYYVDENNSDQLGIIDIKDVSEASYLDIETEILNKRYFKSGSGLEFINGLKIQFIGNIYPETYKNNFWYVEGVGSKIKLIKDTDLTLPNVSSSGSSLGGFDSGEFDSSPFEAAGQLIIQKNYIVINRSSRDRNAWSRTNRWFHKSVIEASAIANGLIPSPDQTQRAKRPIIEFNPDIKLYNMGWRAKTDVDFVDTFTTDVFSTIEGSTGYKIDGDNPLLNGYRVLFLADKDPLVYGKIFEVKFIRNANLNRQQITLREVIDTDPQEGESVFVRSGLENAGCAYHYDGALWHKAQNKTKVNQTPLFDLFDKDLISYSNQVEYPNTSFSGNEMFSYKIGSSVIDSELGFSISYRSINNTGDIEFEFDLQNSSYTYQTSDNVIGNLVSNNAFVRIFEDDGTFRYGNGWTKTDRPIDQLAARMLQVTSTTDRIPIDIFENSGSLYDMKIRVYVNDVKRNDLSIETINNLAYIKFGTNLNVGDKVIYKIRSVASKNLKGYYEIPSHWEKNPLNETLDSFTLGEVIDHVKTIIENTPEFDGVFPGTGNLSKLGPVSQYGRRFLQHSSPMPLAAFSLIDKDANVIKALRWNAIEYSRFKKEFLRLAENLSFDGTTDEIVDQILLKLTESYKVDINPFYFSDMAPYGAHSHREYEVVDPRLPYFIIDSIYNPKSITKRTILVYLNQVPLIYGRDYSFRDDDAFIEILAPLSLGDKILIKDYSNSDGCYIPFTPTSLGLYPSFVPEIFIDDTYVEPTKVIQGHDGSIIKAYNDYRDAIILDLECRIFNSIRIDYNPQMFDINDLIPGNYRRGDFTKSEFNTVILSDFLNWNNKISQDFSINSYHVETEPFTYNYSRSIAPNGKEALLGFWRGIYRYFYDTDRPHTHPWEMQGFSIKPIWWDDVYGARPYTNQNKILWDDIEAGFIRDPQNPRYVKKYARPGMSVHLPIDQEGNLLSPLDSDIAFSFSLINSKGTYVFGDCAPVETAWRRSSEYAFAIVKAMCVLRGSEFIGKMWDRFRVIQNITGQIVYEPTGRHLQTKDLLYPDVKESNNEFRQTSGLVNMIDEFVGMQKNIKLSVYKETLTNINAKMSYRIGGFTNKDKIKVVLDSRSPNSTGTVFVSDENYKIFYNKSAPVDTIVYSGVLIEKRTDGYAVYGYDNARNYFETYTTLTSQNDPSFNVGGVSESFVTWTANKFYTRSQIVRTDEGVYYRAKISHTSSENFTTDLDKWQQIPNLPLVGGRTAIKRRRFDDVITKIPYGTVYTDIQSVVDFLLGYQQYLTSVGFVFDNYNKSIGSPLDWFTSAKEFMFWTLQGWQEGAVITLSPSATKLEFKANINAAIDNLDEDFFEYSIFKANGQPLKPDQTSIYRSGNGFVIQPASDTLDGIFHVRTNLVYKEHVLLIDNTTVFNDIIYDKVPGYRQGRVKIIGYKTNKWDGGLTSPGFVYDAATVNDWQEFTDYNIGDIVLYRNYYYTATQRIPGSEDFDQNKWKKLDQEPVADLIPNFDYKVEQFRDFYELEAGNFDQAQQMLARHLVGFQSRQYLEDIINDDVAQFKFYQGFIKEKGTMNSITKLFDARRASMIGGINIKEEWAFKVGDYGAVDMISEIELNLNEEKMLFNPQNLVFSLNKQELNDSSIYNIISTDISVKPLAYNGNPFVTKELDPSMTNYGQFKYRVAGYVKEEDADHILLNHDALINYNYDILQDRDIIWVGYTSNNDWNIYQYYNTKIFIQNYSISGQTVKLECSKIPDIKTDDYVVIKNLDSLNGIYKVQNVYNNFVEVFAFNADDIYVDTTDSTAGVLFKIESVRHATSASIAPRRYNDLKIHGDKLWIDSDSENNWMVLENVDSFTESALGPLLKYDRQRFGFEVKITKDNNWMYVSVTNYDGGKVIAYNRPNRQSDWSFIQTISLPTGYNSFSGTEQFGYSVDAVSNGSMLVISAPTLSGLRSYYADEFDPGESYLPGEIVRDAQDRLWMAMTETNNDGSTTINEYSQDWDRVYSYEGRKAGTFTGPTNQGAVFVFEYDYVSLRYEIAAVLGSYNPTTNEKFGTKVKIVGTAFDSWLFVSSKNYNNDTGRVQIFRKTTDGSTIGNDGSTLTPTYAWKFNTQVYLDLTHTLGNYGSYIPTTESLYGHDIDALPDASRVAVSAPGFGSGTVYIFQQIGDIFELVQAINSVSIANGQTVNNAGSAGALFTGDMFGYSLAMTTKRLFVGAPQDDNAGTNVGSVFLFDYVGEDSSNNPYRLLQVIVPPSIIDNERFGTKLAVNPDENLLAVSAIGGATTKQTTFDLHTRRLNELDIKDYELNPYSDTQTPTTFDSDSTGFFDKIPYTGTVYVFNRFDSYFIYGDTLKPINDLSSYDNFGHALAVSSDTVAVGTPEKYLGQYRYGDTFIFKYSDLSWSIKEKQSALIDINKFKKAFIYNTKEKELTEYLDFVDPAKGRIPGIADQEIKYQTYFDPAVYQYGDETEVSIDLTTPWTNDHIGEVWWDLSKVKFQWYEQGDYTYRNNNWGKLFPGCTIDVYEWVESRYKPSEWARLADTDEGIALGLTGIPKYTDDFTFSLKYDYDITSGTKTALYYYWVKNKKTVPVNSFRTLNTVDIANLIADPRAEGYKFVAITGKNSLSLVNINNRVNESNTALNLQFYLTDNTEAQVHRQYVLIAEDDPSAKIPPAIENKWYDSLSGSDITGARVPDPKLSLKQRYGTENEPRQTWFINRFEALKQLVDHVNSVLSSKSISDEIDFTNLNRKDPPPTLRSCRVDQIVDILDELRFVGTAKIRRARLAVTVNNGLISAVSIVDKGYGYKTPPTVKIIGTGKGAQIKTYIDKLGQIIDAKVIRTGNGYDTDTIVEVRNFSVLVNIDSEANNGWSIQEWNIEDRIQSNGSVSQKKRWLRYKTQAYDVTKYWSFKDWYLTDSLGNPLYDLSSDIAHEVDYTYELYGLSAAIGDIVKVKNANDNQWLLLQRISTLNGPDATSDYSVVGKQNGTIEFSGKLYNLGKEGYDSIRSFDVSQYDSSPSTELRIILEALRDDVLIGELRVEYVKAFFNSIHYLMSEQLYIDWVFKTSFLKVNHLLGTLKQRATFQSDSIASYQSFIEEAKPYKSKIREFVSSYDAIDPAPTLVTDFDLPSYYDIFSQKIEVTTLDSYNVSQLPWKNWYENYKHTILNIVLEDGGSGYITAPKVIISGGGGSGAKATAYVASGKVYKIVLEEGGEGYLTKPDVFLSGGNGDIESKRAKAYAIIGNNKVRTNLIGIKFDRMSPTISDTVYQTDYFFGTGVQTRFKLTYTPYLDKGDFSVAVNNIQTSLAQYTVEDGGYLNFVNAPPVNSEIVVSYYKNIVYRDQFVATANTFVYQLTYAPEIEKNKFKITIDGLEIYGEQFSVILRQSGTELLGYVRFAAAPSTGSTIIIEYFKNVRILDAANRIEYAYEPREGQYGKELGLLMSGVDYGGVNLTSIEFDIGTGWDVLGWDVTSWDSVITSNDDYAVVSDGSTREFELPYIPEMGEVINVYLNNVRIDDPYYDLYDGSTVQPNGLIDPPNNAEMNSFVGNGVANVITIPPTVSLVGNFNPDSIYDIITFRKSTSDGSILPTDRSLIDTFVNGGNLEYSSALGITAGEIVVDGDGLVTSDTSHGPEELLQGQVVDSLDIKVYNLPSSGGPNFIIRNYIGDGANNEFPLDAIPGTANSIFVIMNGRFLTYSLDYENNLITLGEVPPLDENLAIMILDTAGFDIVDKVNFIGDGSTTEFLTSATYSLNNVTALVLVDGVSKPFELAKSTASDGADNNVLIKFPVAPADRTLIQVMVFNGSIRKWSQISTQNIPVVSGQLTYTLDPQPQFVEPLSAMAIVIIDDDFLQAPDFEYYTYSGPTYQIQDLRYALNSLTLSDVNLYKNGVKMDSATAYEFDAASNTFTVNTGFADTGDMITVEVNKYADFTIDSDQLILSTNNYTTINRSLIKVTTFTNHDILKIRTNSNSFEFAVGFDLQTYDTQGYDLTSNAINASGIIDLPREISDTSGLFVSFSRTLLTPNVHYVLLDNKKQIKVLLPQNLRSSDYLQVTTFNPETVKPSFGYKIFKDMLNRHHYKRLDDDASTLLAREFKITDTEMHLVDASKLPLPTTNVDYPSAVYVAGERIEYFAKDNNVLSKLRRGTLGTGSKNVIPAGTQVMDVGVAQTVPYADQEIKKVVIADGSTRNIDLEYRVNATPGTIDDGSSAYNGWYRETETLTASAGSFVVGTTYTILSVGTTDFKTIGSASNAIGTKFVATGISSGNGTASYVVYTSIPTYYGQCDEIEVFVGGRRLRKNPIKIYDPLRGASSPNGDKYIEAEYSVDDGSYHVRLTEVPEVGQTIVVIKKTGRLWQDLDNPTPLGTSNSNIANFLTVKQVSLPK